MQMQNAHNVFLSPYFNKKPYTQPDEMLFCLPVMFDVADIYKLTTITKKQTKTPTKLHKP